MIPLNRVMTWITRIALTDKMSLKALILLPKTRMRKDPHPTMTVRDEHIVTDVERATTLEGATPMMIIGENGDTHVAGTMTALLTHQIQAVRVDRVDPLDPTDIGHHVIMMTKEHICQRLA